MSKVGADASKSPSRDFSGLGAILAIATTLVVGVFTALGVSGNLLARMVRNHPHEARFVLLVTIIAVLGIALVTALPMLPNWLVIVPVLILGAGLIKADFVAARSQSERENPSITLSLSRTTPGGLILTAKASGSSLRSHERMLMRVAAISRTLSVAEVDVRGDTNMRTTELRDTTNRECKRAELHPADPRTTRLMAWTETGPNASGDAATEQTMPVPADAKYICAWVILSTRSDFEPAAENFALVDLKGLR